MSRFLLSCFALLVCACSAAPDPNAVPMSERLDTTESTQDGLRVVRFDVNRDQRPNIWKYYKDVPGPDGRMLEIMVRKELDLNADGHVDVIRHYDEQGKVTKEELDLSFDRRIDVINYFEDGVLVRAEMDLNFDGVPDLFRYYRQGKLVRLERDTNFNGQIDYWEYYEEGRLDRVGYDISGDGQIDRMDRRKSAEDE